MQNEDRAFPFLPLNRRDAKPRRHLEAGAYMTMVESEGITERVRQWRTDAPAALAREIGLEKLVFEAADPEVNLFVDHSQIVQLECLRSGVWGTAELWGRVATYRA